MTLGEKIKSAREALGLNQDELADILNVEPPTVSRWENNVIKPKTKRLKVIAEKLKKPIEWFQEPVVSAGDFEARLKALEDRAAVIAIANAKKEAPIPLLIQENWDKAGPTIQSIVLYLLSGESEYKQNLQPEPKSLLESLTPYAGRTPWRFSKGE